MRAGRRAALARLLRAWGCCGARCSGAGAPPLPVRPRLDTVPAHGHVAPRARAVARVVVEGPPALLAPAGLEPRPRPLSHRRRDDREHAAERSVDAAGGGLLAGAPLREGAKREPRSEERRVGE